MIPGARKVGGAYEGVIRDVGEVIWHCPHLHRKRRRAIDCAWKDLRGIVKSIDREDRARGLFA